MITICVPGVTVLKAGEHELGPVFCDCPCHKKPESEERN
jgi:hypothetical protein